MRAPDDDAVLAAERTVRSILRGQYVGFTRDDLLQEGRLAAWLARQSGRVPAEPEHARRYLARRTRGAMLDTIRRTGRQIPHGAVEWTPEMEAHAPTPDPDARLRMHDAVARLLRRATVRTMECIERLASGDEPCEVAQAMGISEVRVSQLRSKARAAVGDDW